MYEGFRERHQTVLNLFRSEECSFVTVCAPTEPSVEVAGFFSEQLSERGYPRGGTVVNQVHLCGDVALDPQALLGSQAKELSEDLEDWTAASLVARLGAAHRRLRALAAGERALIEKVQVFSSGFLLEIPRLEGEVHDLQGLARIASFLFETPVSTES